MAFEAILPEEEAYIDYASVNLISWVNEWNETTSIKLERFHDFYLQVVARNFFVTTVRVSNFFLSTDVYYDALSYDQCGNIDKKFIFSFCSATSWI